VFNSFLEVKGNYSTVSDLQRETGKAELTKAEEGWAFYSIVCKEGLK
jgi:hypothetical protein